MKNIDFKSLLLGVFMTTTVLTSINSTTNDVSILEDILELVEETEDMVDDIYWGYQTLDVNCS